jgi:hypothetical protein
MNEKIVIRLEEVTGKQPYRGKPTAHSSRTMWLVGATLMFVVGIITVVLIVTGFGTGYRNNIERVLREDAALSAQIAQDVGVLEVAWDQSAVVGKYVSGIRQINLRGCPQDFQDAFRNHIQAWAAYERTARSYGGINGFIKGFLTNGLAAIDAYSEGDAAQREIELTWHEVLRIAAEYHAKTPQ